MLVAAIGLLVVCLLWRFHRSPVGHVLVAIRENEQRARFIGYPTDRYKLFAFTVSAADHGARRHALGVPPPLRLRRADLGGVLRRAAGDGGDRRHALVPRAGARRACSSSCSANSSRSGRRTGCCSSASCSSASSCSRRPASSASPSACSRRSASARSRPPRWRAARSRRTRRCRPRSPRASRADGPVLIARELAKSFGGIRAVANADIVVEDRTLHALIGPNGAGKTTAFNLLSGMFPPDAGFITVAGQPVTGFEARGHYARRRRPLVPDHQPVRRPDRSRRTCGLPCRRGTASASPGGRRPRASPRSTPRPLRSCAISASPASSAPRPPRSPMAASACSTWGSRSRPRRTSCCSTSRSPASRRRSARASPRW